MKKIVIASLAIVAVGGTVIGFSALPALSRSGHGLPPMLQEADKDGDGKLSCEEFKAMKAARFASFDTNNDGGLSAEEIIAGREAMKRKRVEAKVASADTDGNGVLSEAAFTEMMKKHGRGKGKRHGMKGKHGMAAFMAKYDVCD